MSSTPPSSSTSPLGLIPDSVRYEQGPIALMAVTILSVQVLAAIGGGGLTLGWSLFGSFYAWKIVTGLAAWAFLPLLAPGPEYTGPAPPNGAPSPTYRANGIQYYAASVLFAVVSFYFYPDIAENVYVNFPKILAVCNIAALGLCGYLWWAGKNEPQVKETLPVRPPVYEFYSGMELHPRLLGVDVKQFTNCRFGLMAWQLLIACFFLAGWERNGFNVPHFISVVLQTIYLAKFYWWETGYFNTLDIILDRAGYYLCWGCLVFVPGFYTFTSFYFVAQPPVISNSGACLCLFLGLISISLNYRVDWEKEYFRSKNGLCNIWLKPAKFIKANLATEGISSKGKNATKPKPFLLLTSGFWGIARHINYLFEMLLALSWCLPGVGLGLWPFLYFFFLVALLVHRIFRDEEKCKAKYGKYWDDYCKAVPYRLIPGIF